MRFRLEVDRKTPRKPRRECTQCEYSETGPPATGTASPKSLGLGLLLSYLLEFCFKRMERVQSFLFLLRCLMFKPRTHRSAGAEINTGLLAPGWEQMRGCVLPQKPGLLPDSCGFVQVEGAAS